MVFESDDEDDANICRAKMLLVTMMATMSPLRMTAATATVTAVLRTMIDDEAAWHDNM